MITGTQVVKIEQNGQVLEVPVDSISDLEVREEVEPVVTSPFLKVGSVVLKR